MAKYQGAMSIVFHKISSVALLLAGLSISAFLFPSCSAGMGEEERAEIVEVLTNKITPEGVGDLKYGQPMSEVALSQKDSTTTAYAVLIITGINMPGIDIPDKTGTYRLPIHVLAIGNGEVGYYGPVGYAWNPDSKLTYFAVNIIDRDVKDWVDTLLHELVDGYRKRGYKEILREKNNIKNAIVLSKGAFNIFIEDNGENEIFILCGYNLIGSRIYKDYRQVFTSPKNGCSII